jgi:anti-anti-sigma factor
VKLIFRYRLSPPKSRRHESHSIRGGSFQQAGRGRTSMLQLAIQNSGEVTTVWCRGRIVLGGRLNLFKVAASSQTSAEVMLDLSRVNLIDAAGLGALVDLHKRFQCASRTMKLRDPTSFVYHVFRITRLDTVFYIFRTPDIGLAERKPRVGRSSSNDRIDDGLTKTHLTNTQSRPEYE